MAPSTTSTPARIASRKGRVGLEELEGIAEHAVLLPRASRVRAQARARSRSTALAGAGTREAMARAWATLVILAMPAPFGCAREGAPSAPRVQPPPVQPPATPSSSSAVDPPRPSWAEPLASALAGRGLPHAQPMALPRDARGRERWLAFVGTPDVALGAWHVVRADDGTVEATPVARWPAGVRVLGGFVDHANAYVLLESLGVLDQPAGLRAGWIDGGRSSPFEASPLALSDVVDIADLGMRVQHPPQVVLPEGGTSALLATLRAASGSSEALVRSLSAEGADIEVAWQALFLENAGHIDPGAPQGPLTERALAIVRDALGTQACGPDTCEAWSDRGRAVVRFALQEGRWVVRAFIEDAPVARPSTPLTSPHEVEGSATADATSELLRARVRETKQLLGE